MVITTFCVWDKNRFKFHRSLRSLDFEYALYRMKTTRSHVTQENKAYSLVNMKLQCSVGKL